LRLNRCNPFWHIASGYNEYASSPNTPGFFYGTLADPTYGLLPLAAAQKVEGIIGHQSGIAQINAVGRHHPTADATYAERYGGSANFLFCDGHVENMTVLESMAQRKWGDAYYSLTGANRVLNYDND